MSVDTADALNATDREMLAAMADGNPTTAVALAEELDRERTYLNTRLRQLDLLDLVEREARGVYRITTRGEEVAADA